MKAQGFHFFIQMTGKTLLIELPLFGFIRKLKKRPDADVILFWQ